MVFILLCNAIVIWKFIFICIWKSYRSIDDSFWALYTITSTFLVTFLLSSGQMFGPGEVPSYEMICTGIQLPKLAQNEQRFINIELAYMAGIFGYFVFLVPVLIQKRRITIQENQGTKNLACHTTNVILLAFVASAGLALSLMKMITNPNEFQIYRVFYTKFCIPFMFTATISIHIVKKHGKDINRELFNGYFNVQN